MIRLTIFERELYVTLKDGDSFYFELTGRVFYVLLR